MPQKTKGRTIGFYCPSETEAKLNELLKALGVNGVSKSEIFNNFIDKLHAHFIVKNQFRNSDTSEPISETETDNDFFDCQKLCRNFKICTSEAMNHLGEIEANNCFRTRYPTKCKFQMWESNQPFGDPQHPYPKCIAKQTKIPIDLPKDRIIRNPQICWTCIMTRKRERESKTKPSDSYKRQPKIIFPHESPDLFKIGDRT